MDNTANLSSSKKKKRKSPSDVNSPRHMPEGDSINTKKVLKIKKTKSPMPSKLLSDSENVSPNKVTLKEKKRRSSGSATSPGKKVKLNDSSDEIEHVYENRDVIKNKKIRQKSTGSLNASWEKAVEKARGMPDGATESREDSFFTYSDPNSPTKKEIGKTVDKNVGKKDVKGNKNHKNLLQAAAKKLKKIGGTKNSTDSPQGTKRKRTASGDDTDSLTKKEKKKQRRMLKNNYELTCQAKTLWSKLGRKNLSEEERHKLSAELLTLIQGKAKELIFAHDTSRVLQCMMKYGTEEHRTAVFEELREHTVEMMKSKYAKFFVRRLLKYGTKAQRHYVLRQMYGNVKKLIRHQEASELVEMAYNEYTNAQQRAALVEEFYGPSFALFKSEEARTLDQIMKVQPEKRDTILRNMKEALSSLVDKSICSHSIVHRVFLEYFTYAPPQQKTDMIEIVREQVVHMLHTRDGARVAMHCLWSGTAKDRKVIAKTFKTYIAKICKEEYGHMVLLVLFDVTDDTKFVHKVVINEILASVDELALDKHGRKVLLYLLSPRDPHFFNPDIVRVLQEGDSNPHSKKDMAVRRQELLDTVSDPLVKFLVSNAKTLVMHSGALWLLMTIITKASCDVKSAVNQVAKIASEPYVAGSLEQFHIVEHPAGHMILKKLIVLDAQRVKEGKDLLFSDVLVNTVSESNLKSWAASNRGCLILANLLEINHPSVTLPIKKALVGIKSSLEKMDFTGAKVLLKKLN